MSEERPRYGSGSGMAGSRDVDDEAWAEVRALGLAGDSAIPTALRALRSRLDHVHRLPDLEWAEVMAVLMAEAAKVARAGHQPNATAMKEALDRGKTYVARLRAEVEELTALVDAYRDACGDGP